ncbi:MAG: rhamnulokinase [Brevinema sp.]
MSHTNNFVCIDLGASSGRVIIYEVDIKQEQINEIELHRFCHNIGKNNKYLVWDLDLIKKEILVGLTLAAPYNPISIGVDSWGVDIILKDDKGESLLPPISYRDGRTDGLLEKFINESSLPKKDIYQKTGIQFLPFNTLYQLYSVSLEHPDVLKKARNILMISDEINHFLTGISRIEYTGASTTQMINLKTQTWDDDLLRALKMNPNQFAPLAFSGSVLGNISSEIARQTGLPEKTHVVNVAGHDTASAIAAVDTKTSQGAYLSSGTWSLIGIESTSPHINNFTFEESFSHEAGVESTYRVLKNIMGLWVISRIKQDTKNNDSFENIISRIEKKAHLNVFIDLNNDIFLNPPNMIQSIDQYLQRTGQKPLKEIDDYFQSVYENLALSYSFYLEKLTQLQPINYLHIFGGGSKNHYLNQMTSNFSQKPVLAGPSEASALGNMLMQLVGLDLMPSVSEARAFLSKCLRYKQFTPKETPSTLMDGYKEHLNKCKSTGG